MKRRTLLISIGGAVGTAGAVGTGAFTSVEADRDVSVSVANENNAYLGIEPSPSASPNSEFATQDSSNNNQIALEFDDSGNSGSGVGLSSVYDFDDVFRVTNQGTQTIYVWANFSGGDLSDDDIWFYPDGESSRKLNDGTNSVVTVPVGETIKMGVHIDTNVLESTENETLTATLTADVDVPSGSNPSDGVGEDAAVVSKDPDQGEYSTIQDAIDAVNGTTVYVEPGIYEESVTIDVDGLTLKGPNADIDGSNSASRSDEAVIDGVMRIRAGSGTTVDGFALEHNPDVEDAGAGVLIGDAGGDFDDVTVSNNVITGDQQAGGFGVQIENADDVTIEHNLITETATGSDRDIIGIGEFDSNIDGLMIFNNTIETQDGVLLGGGNLSAVATISSNDFLNNRAGAVTGPNGDLTITNNNFDGASYTESIYVLKASGSPTESLDNILGGNGNTFDPAATNNGEGLATDGSAGIVADSTDSE